MSLLQGFLPKLIFICRGFRHRHGHGVHSPFVFHLISKVIESPGYTYYCFNEINLLRKKFLQSQKLSKKEKAKAITSKNGELLFRLTNEYKPKDILQIGPSDGLSILYMTAYAKGLTCKSLQPDSKMTKWVYKRLLYNSVETWTGDYETNLPKVLTYMENFDFVYFSAFNEQKDSVQLFTECAKQTNTNSFFVLHGIHADMKAYRAWEKVKKHPAVTVSVELSSLGIVFFNEKLNKQDFIIYY
ncbi:SAM-dependent methyltransferase [Parabacteroides sp. OttesenSCG-928-G07]|nr:SAM-dependent methyltransferase [Parabacteroides sp. OttesenSCG-928-G21]MDL2277962.1 SAM-dependent methyltransferase [Parabacteroides sp. OttesenSCG-928-G07]